MKERSGFNLKKANYSENPVFISKLLDPYTVKIAKFMYNLGFSANLITFLNFIIGITAIVIILTIKSYVAMIVAAILITLRNIGDTIDGKIARGSNTVSKIGWFSDIISDWLFFHAGFFIALGFLTNNIVIGFLCVTGYMSREFARRVFTKIHGVHIAETEEAKKISLIASVVKKYDLANVFWIIPIFLLINQPAFIIYAVAIIEYVLLFGELGFDFFCLVKGNKKQKSK